GDGVSETTVTAEAAQDGAIVGVAPADADAEAEGHQVALAGLDEITVTVTSADGSRERTYRVRFAEAVEAGSSPSCLHGAVSVGFSLVVSEGGSVDDLVACGERRHATALYVLHEGEWVSHILGAPDFVNAPFRALFADGVPALLPLVVRSEGPPSPAPAAPEATEPLATCMRGEVAQGFSLVVYEGGTVDELASCAEAFGISAIYALADDEWVSYILAAPDFVNARFRELFADGVPIAAPLVVRSEVR
ncbi:MAG: cadherin-like beta sandwich domain-containing protein, partial [Chloroflexi bacterium]|nr:cadherin-like beta sandwich domain-containing protein [Chloroflexota bacterium]